jgi:hypothetical protein
VGEVGEVGRRDGEDGGRSGEELGWLVVVCRRVLCLMVGARRVRMARVASSPTTLDNKGRRTKGDDQGHERRRGDVRLVVEFV